MCTEAEFACHSHNECIALEYRCDRRPDCRDMSDELNCGEGPSGATGGLQTPGGARAPRGLQVYREPRGSGAGRGSKGGGQGYGKDGGNACGREVQGGPAERGGEG